MVSKVYWIVLIICVKEEKWVFQATTVALSQKVPWRQQMGLVRRPSVFRVSNNYMLSRLSYRDLATRL